MKRANSDSRVAGFSLIEAMATLALTATIILALSRSPGNGAPTGGEASSICSARTCSASALSGSSTTYPRPNT